MGRAPAMERLMDGRRDRLAHWRMGLLMILAIGLWATSFSAGARARVTDAAVSFQDDEPTAAVAQRGPVSLAQARAMATRRIPGRVVRAETVTQGGGRRVHQIRILDAAGGVRTVRIDAQTGTIL